MLPVQTVLQARPAPQVLASLDRQVLLVRPVLPARRVTSELVVLQARQAPLVLSDLRDQA